MIDKYFSTTKSAIGNIGIAVILMICFSYAITIVILIQFSLPTAQFNFSIKIVLITILLLSMLMKDSAPSKINSIQIGIIGFFIIYSCRLFYDVVINGILIENQSIYQVLGFFFALTLVPVFYIILYLRPFDVLKIHNWSFGLLITANFALAISVWLRGNLYLDTAFSGRFEVSGEIAGTTVLNPILVGLVGALLLSFCLARIATGLAFGLWQMIIHGALIILSFTNLLFGGSRGPFVGFLLSTVLLLAVLILPNKYSAQFRGSKAVLLALGGVTVVIIGLILTDSIQIYLFDRMLNTFSDRLSGQGEERDFIFTAAWDEFLSNPIIGSSYALNGYLPHNVILEALMATGLVGASFLGAAAFGAIRGTWRVACGCVGPYGLPLALVTVTYAAIGLTSYSVGQSPELWIFIAISSTLGRFTIGPDGHFFEQQGWRS